MSMQEAVADLVTPWTIAYAVAIVASAIAMFVKVRVFYLQLRCATNLLENVNSPTTHA